jgi:hypothetical protein
MANEKVKVRRPSGLASISTKTKYAALVQAVATLVIVFLQGGLTAEALPTAITTVITAVIGLTIKDTVPEGTVVEYPAGDFEI